MGIAIVRRVSLSTGRPIYDASSARVSLTLKPGTHTTSASGAVVSAAQDKALHDLHDGGTLRETAVKGRKREEVLSISLFLTNSTGSGTPCRGFESSARPTGRGHFFFFLRVFLPFALSPLSCVPPGTG